MTETLYLIAHRVRGLPAFDIAVRDGEDWVMPTTGCKVYPHWFSPLAEELGTNAMDRAAIIPDDWQDYQKHNLVDWPDDYGEFLDYKRTRTGQGSALLSALGFQAKLQEPLKRRF